MKKIIILFVAAAIFYDLFSPLRLLFDGGKALMMLFPTLLIIFYDRLYLKKSFLPVLIFIFTGVLLNLFGSEYAYFGIPTLLGMLFACGCFEHYIVTRDSQYAKTILFVTYGVLMFTILVSIPLFMTVPHLSRMLLDAEEHGVTDPIMFWTVSFPTIHDLPVYSIPIFYLLRTSKKKFVRLFSLFVILSIFVLMIFADATMSLILTVVMYGILLIYNPKRSYRDNLVLFILIGLFMLVLLNKTVLIGILQFIQPYFEDSTTFEKIDDIIYSLSGHGTTGDVEARSNLLKRSLDSFISNPFLPELKNDNIGKHNFLIDIVVAMGLFLSVTFILFITNRLKRPLRFINKETKPYYYLCILVLLAMGFTKNFFLLFPTCCIAPMFFIMSNWKTD
jgi:hypothetical protein